MRVLKYPELLKFPTKKCRICGVELTKENWWPSRKAACNHICNECSKKERMQFYNKRKEMMKNGERKI